MSDHVYMDSIPACDLCRGAGRDRPAEYDAKTKQGPWAYLCHRHYLMHRFYQTLGTGKGQRLYRRKA